MHDPTLPTFEMPARSTPFITRRPNMIHVSKAPLGYISYFGTLEADKIFNVKGTYRKLCNKCKK